MTKTHWVKRTGPTVVGDLIWMRIQGPEYFIPVEVLDIQNDACLVKALFYSAGQELWSVPLAEVYEKR